MLRQIIADTMTNVRRQTVNGSPGDAIQYQTHFLILNDTMNTVCASCKYGYDRKPGGEKPSSGTVWCGKRKLQMAKHRQMDCFTPLPGIKVRHCADCKRAKITLPSGGALQLGNVWCDRKKTEIHKMRSMDCFE